MKKKLLMTTAFLALSIGVASAAGLNLGWLECAAGAGPANRASGCTSNIGSNLMIGSFVAPAGLVEVTGFAAILDIQTAAPTLPDWFNYSACHAGGMSHTAGFASGAFCLDYFTTASGSGVFIPGAPKQARVKEGWAFPGSSLLIGPLPEGEEVYAFQISLSNSKTTGAGACVGCLTPACIVFNELLVTNRPGNVNGNKLITNPASRAHVTWQGGGNVLCPDATPTRKATWGSIKTLYR